MAPHILLLGGHGKISLLMTPKFVSRSWDLTSVIRNQDQKSAILEAGKNGPGKVNVLVESLDEVKSEGDAKRILDHVKPDWVVWSAGAGGKGGADRTYAIDRDVCIHFIRAALATPTITKFLLVSALTCRRERAPWWNDEVYTFVQKINAESLPDYYKAKLAADEVLTVLGEDRVKKDGVNNFTYIDLRPGLLGDGPETGKVSLGLTNARGVVSRADVADIAVRLLEKDGAKGWFDMLDGKEEAGAAVERVVGLGIDSREGEDLEVMKANM